ncbi:MAG TPA: SulP family inorganic anion transporter [Lacipirellulaceae bacterium]|nr:SulP family inorganic anion transporter [Lacipirellulaceae bacterium]
MSNTASKVANRVGRGGTESTWGADALASVVVFFVALPLCMGIALASGAPVAAGLLTGIIGGIVVGALSGCPLQVSGPAAGLTVIVYEIVQELGLPLLGLAVLIAGVLQIAAGLLKLGQWFRAVSPAVIKGMLAGIGVLIFASQFHVMVDDKPRGSGLDNLLSIPEAVWKGMGAPYIPEQAERDFRTASLKAISKLSHDQTNLRTEVGELAPFHEDVGTTPELRDVVVGDLAELADRQHGVTAELERLGAELQAVEGKVGVSQHLERAREALAEASSRSVAAARALEAGRAVEAVHTQADASVAIAAATSRLKNHRLAAELGLLTIVVIMLWQKFAPRKLRLVPGPLIAVSLATAIAAAFYLPVLYVEVPGSLADEIHWPSMTLLRSAPWAAVLQSGLLIAVVASAETLLSAAAVSQLAPESRTDYDRELTAQGVGNTLCGLVGALPMTGVIVRSSANIQAGARTRKSAIMHGIWLLVFVAGFARVLTLIPTASLAAVLVYTGYKLVDLKSMKKLLEVGWGELAIYLATLITIVVDDLLMGVIVGVVLAAGKLLYTFSHLKIRIKEDPRHNRWTIHLTGAATFVRLPQLAAALEQIPDNTELHVDLLGLSYIDHACLELITNWATQHEATGGQLSIDWDSLHASFRQESADAAEHEAA